MGRGTAKRWRGCRLLPRSHNQPRPKSPAGSRWSLHRIPANPPRKAARKPICRDSDQMSRCQLIHRQALPRRSFRRRREFLSAGRPTRRVRLLAGASRNFSPLVRPLPSLARPGPSSRQPALRLVSRSLPDDRAHEGPCWSGCFAADSDPAEPSRRSRQARFARCGRFSTSGRSAPPKAALGFPMDRLRGERIEEGRRRLLLLPIVP